MKILLVRIFLFCLVPAGGFVLYKAIKMVRKTFFGDTLVTLPFSEKSAVFEVSKSGVYAIWQEGQYFKKMPLDIFRPVIVNTSENRNVKIIPSLFRPNSNDGNMVKMEIFRFRADPGIYRIDLAEGVSISKIEQFISSLVPAKKADLNQYWILVKESQPFYLAGIAIMLMVLSVLLIIGGLLTGIMIK